MSLSAEIHSAVVQLGIQRPMLGMSPLAALKFLGGECNTNKEHQITFPTAE